MNATISRRYDFESAHHLPHVAEGHKCRRVHGHSYFFVVFITGPVKKSGPEKGMVVDFDKVDAIAAALKAKVDHTLLNESLHPNPTVENMAPLVWAPFAKGLPGLRVDVTFGEGPRSTCEYPPRSRKNRPTHATSPRPRR